MSKRNKTCWLCGEVEKTRGNASTRKLRGSQFVLVVSGSIGTANLVRRAKAAGVRVIVAKQPS